jgi:hypothetical protein
MIEIGKWRKDIEQSSVDRWILPLSKIPAGARCLDFQCDAYGSRDFTLINRDYKWLERHTVKTSSQSVYKESGIDETFIIAYIFEEL